MSQVKTKKQVINGVEYTFQLPSVREVMEMQMRWEDPSLAYETNDIIMAEELLEHVVIKPKLSIDDFNTLDELSSVTTPAAIFATTGK